MINHIKLEYLQSKLAEGERDLINDRYTELKQEELSDHFKIIKKRAADRVKQDKQITHHMYDTELHLDFRKYCRNGRWKSGQAIDTDW